MYETEDITVAGKKSFDWDGNLVESKESVIHGCVVQPHTTGNIKDNDVVLGEDKKVTVFTPAGVVLERGTNLTIRGKTYTVIQDSWDWGYSRKPVNPRHTPKATCIAERVEG